MSGPFITSDEHLGHLKIVEYVNRPYTTVEEGVELMIARHNKKVPNNPNVLTIHDGDWFWDKPSEDGYWTATEAQAISVLERLNGGHAFIYGNHDELIERSPKLRSMLKWIVGRNKESGSRIIHWNKHEITINHFAMTRWNRSHKGAWMLYGHSHGDYWAPGKSFDIGVDCHRFEPWSMEEIEAEMAKRPVGHVIERAWPGKELPNAESDGDILRSCDLGPNVL